LYKDLFSCITSSDPEDFGVVKRLERIQIAPVEDVSWDVHWGALRYITTAAVRPIRSISDRP